MPRLSLALAAAAAAATVALAPHPAAACAFPGNELHTTLTMVSADGTTLPPDGALLVRRTVRFGHAAPGHVDDAWTVETADGHPVEIEIMPLADGLERWRIKTSADRDLAVVAHDGAVIGRYRQRTTGARHLRAPRVRRLTSNLVAARRMPLGVPASDLRLDLAAAAPRGVTLVFAELMTGASAVPWFLADAPAGRRLTRSTFAHKGCVPGPNPVAAGTRLRFRWVDAAGRLSPASSTITVRKRR